MSDYPLCEQADLPLFKRNSSDPLYGTTVIRAADVENMLEQALVVYATDDHGIWGPPDNDNLDSFTGRVVCIKPIAQPKPKVTAEDLLQEYLDQKLNTPYFDFTQKIRAFLEGK